MLCSALRYALCALCVRCVRAVCAMCMLYALCVCDCIVLVNTH